MNAQETTQFGRFFLPGPTAVRAEVLEAQARPVIGHRGREMKELMSRMQPRLRELFRTERPVYISTSSATGLMEAAIRNGVRRKALCLVNGAFSERFRRIARRCGLEADALEVPWGGAHSPEMLAAALERDDYDAVTMVHSETSTGVLNPVRELADAAHAAADDIVVLVDSVSGAGGAPLEIDDWGLDFVVTGGQKALALPPGIAFAVAGERMLDRAEEIEHRGLYFDLLEFERRVHGNQTPNTPAVSLFYALEAQLEHIADEGVEARWERHAAMARRTWAWADEMSERGVPLEVWAPEGARSPTVSCVRLPDGRTGPELCEALRARGYALATGYGPTREEFIRIGHMGDHTSEELEELLHVIEEELQA